jgi:hypothetical protein
MQLNLPATPITDLQVHRGDLVVATQGRSFWILDDLAPLRGMRDEVVRADAHLFAPREAVRWRYRGGFGGPESGGDRADAPEYPPAGAMIDYWLSPEAATGVVTMEIVDASGAVVRAFTSAGEGETERAPDEPSMRRPAMERVGTPRLPAAAGHNRFVWDMAWPGPWDANARRSGRGGPLALPGAYTVRLTAGGRTMTKPLALRIDPRIARDGVTLADLREQLAHNLRARDLVTDANVMAARLRALRAAVGRADGAGGDVAARLTALERRLLPEPVRYGRPGLLTHIGYLYGLTTRADQKIGRDAVARYAELRKELDAMRREVDEVERAARR